MTSKRLYFVLLAVVGLLFVGLVAGAYGTNQLLSQQANKLAVLKAKSLALGQEQISLNKAKKDIAKYANLEKITQSVVPEDKNQAEAVREIVNIADANNVTLGGITFPASTLGAGLINSAAGASAATPSSSPSNSKVGALSQLQPVLSIPGVYQLPITVTGDTNNPVQYSKFINFLSDLEHNRRTAQVSTITIQPDKKNSNYLTFSLSLSEYIKP